MKKLVFFLQVLILLMIILPAVKAVIEEDFANYTRIDSSNRDEDGNDITLDFLKRSYSNENGNYTVTLRDFDAQGTVVLDVFFKGRKETVILRGEWDDNMTNIVFTPPVELFNETMIITPLKIVPPAGIFSCCPEAEININLIRPELLLEFTGYEKSITYDYVAVDPYANWSDSSLSKTSPFDNSTESESGTVDEMPNAYRMNEQIPFEFKVTNRGDAESHDNEVFIDTGGLIIEYGMTYYQLPTLAGEDQDTQSESTSQNRTMKLRFPYPPERLNYTIHGYVKGVKEGITYYYDASMDVTLLPSVKIQKTATREIMLPTRQDIEKIYHSIDANEIYRWLQGGNIYVTIGVTNYQNYEITGLNLTDSSGRQFSVENQSLSWIFDLKPYETKEFKYTAKASRTGILKHPPALLTYSDMNRTWHLRSASPSTEVHGHCVQILKKTDKPVISPGENATVTVTIRNSGDMPSRVRINDTLPENSTLIKGSMFYEGVLSPKDAAAISYDISINVSGQVQLPPPEMYLNGREDEGCNAPILSRITVKEPSIQVEETNITVPVETPVAIPTPPKQQYGFLEGLIPALMLILAVAVLIVLHRTNK